MKHTVRWTRLALADLVEIRDYISADDPQAADALIDGIRQAVGRLTEFPSSGRAVPERAAQGYREVIVPPYRIVYSIVGQEVRILRVWHGRRSMR